MSDTILSMRNVTKTFPGVTALDGVNLDIRAGEVHALVGENGAGKSTLMKVLAGLHKADGGEIVHKGEVVRYRVTARRADARDPSDPPGTVPVPGIERGREHLPRRMAHQRVRRP